MIKVNAIGDACPIPVVKTKNAIKELNGSGKVEVLVDNEIAVQNLTKMANQKGYGIRSEKLEEQKYQVVMTVGEGGEQTPSEAEDPEKETVCVPDSRKHKLVVISSGKMGEGNDELARPMDSPPKHSVGSALTRPRSSPSASASPAASTTKQAGCFSNSVFGETPASNANPKPLPTHILSTASAAPPCAHTYALTTLPS